jgi:hypothetical protein
MVGEIVAILALKKQEINGHDAAIAEFQKQSEKMIVFYFAYFMVLYCQKGTQKTK